MKLALIRAHTPGYHDVPGKRDIVVVFINEEFHSADKIKNRWTANGST